MRGTSPPIRPMFATLALDSRLERARIRSIRWSCRACPMHVLDEHVLQRRLQPGRTLNRVFWAWFNPEADENKGKVVWEAPSNARWKFGNTRRSTRCTLRAACKIRRRRPNKARACILREISCRSSNKVLSEVYQMPGARRRCDAEYRPNNGRLRSRGHRSQRNSEGGSCCRREECGDD